MSVPHTKKLLQLLLLLTLACLISSCAKTVADNPTEFPSSEIEVPDGESDADSSIDIDVPDPGSLEQGFDFSEMLDTEFPEGFPKDFPIYPGAQLMNDFSKPDEGEYHLFFALQGVQGEEIRSYYEDALEGSEWNIVEVVENTIDGVLTIEMQIEGSSDGRLLITSQEYGSALEISLGNGQKLPNDMDLPVDLTGDFNTLGEGVDGLPADLPIPLSFTPTTLPEGLADDGYLVAFLFDGKSEMAIVELNMAIVSAGWVVGESSLVEGSFLSFIQPFTDSSESFQGYALITNQPTIAKTDTLNGTLIAIAAGSP